MECHRPWGIIVSTPTPSPVTISLRVPSKNGSRQTRGPLLRYTVALVDDQGVRWGVKDATPDVDKRPHLLPIIVQVFR